MHRYQPGSIRAAVLLWSMLHACPFAARGESPGAVTVKVTRIIDGDTFVCRSDSALFTVDLLGAVAPRKDLEQPHHDVSERMLRDLIDGAVLDLRLSRQGDRTMAIAAKAGQSINVAMIEGGGAWYRSPHVESDRLAQAQQLAQQRKVGLWSAKQAPIAPWDYQSHLDSIAEAKRLETTRRLVDIMTRGLSQIGGPSKLETGRAELRIPGSSSSFLRLTYNTDLTVTWELPDRIAMKTVSAMKGRSDTMIIKRQLVLDADKAWSSVNGIVSDVNPMDHQFASDVLRGIGEVAQLPDALKSANYSVDYLRRSGKKKGLRFEPLPKLRGSATPFNLISASPVVRMRIVEIGPLSSTSSVSPFAASLLGYVPADLTAADPSTWLAATSQARLILAFEKPQDLGYRHTTSWVRLEPSSPLPVFVTVKSFQVVNDEEVEQAFQLPDEDEDNNTEDNKLDNEAASPDGAKQP